MSRYAKIENNLVVETREMADNFDPAEVAHKGDFRIVNIQADPVFDPDTHILVTPQGELTSWDFVINPSDVEATRKVRALTQQEIDANDAAAAEQAERELAKTYYQALKAGTATNGQVQRVVARLLKDAYQDVI